MSPADAGDDEVVYTTRAFVRIKRRFTSWQNWNNRLGGGPTVQVTISAVRVWAPQGMMLDSRDVQIDTHHATMSVDRLGWAGTPLGRRECIRLCGGTRRGPIEIAITPDLGIEQTWRAFERAGVRPASDPPDV